MSARGRIKHEKENCPVAKLARHRHEAARWRRESARQQAALAPEAPHPPRPPRLQELRDQEATEVAFRQYLAQRVKDSTITNYVNLTRRALSYLLNRPETAFTIRGLFNTDWSEPVIEVNRGHLENFLLGLTDSVRKGMCQALALFFDFVQHCFDLNEHVPSERRKRIMDNLDLCQRTIRRYRKMAARQTSTGTRENRREAARRGDLTTRPEATMRLIQQTVRSEAFRQRLEELRRVEELLADCTYSPEYVRNLVLAGLIARSAGQRTGAIVGIRIGEWRNAQRFMNTGRLEVAVTAAHHKTAEYYGAATIIIRDPALIAAVEAYVQHVRPILLARRGFDEDEEDSGLFLNREGDILLSHRQAVDWLRGFMTGVLHLSDPQDPTLSTFNSTAVRAAYAAFGKRHQDRAVRENMPSHMRHSAQTRDGHYVADAQLQRSRHCVRAMEDILHGPLVQDGPPQENDNDESLERDTEEEEGPGDESLVSSPPVSAPPPPPPTSQGPGRRPAEGFGLNPVELHILYEAFWNETTGETNITDERVALARANSPETFTPIWDRLLRAAGEGAVTRDVGAKIRRRLKGYAKREQKRKENPRNDGQ